MRRDAAPSMPIVHVMIPADFRGLPATTTHVPSYTWDDIDAGLDGIAIDLPALNVKPTHGEYVPMNIEVSDPLWPMRDMMSFTFSVKPGEAHTLVAGHARPHSAERQEPADHDCFGEPGVQRQRAGRRVGAADLQAVQGRGSGACCGPAGAGA